MCHIRAARGIGETPRVCVAAWVGLVGCGAARGGLVVLVGIVGRGLLQRVSGCA